MARLSFDSNNNAMLPGKPKKSRKRIGRNSMFILSFLVLCAVMFFASFFLAFNMLGAGGGTRVPLPDVSDSEILITSPALVGQIRILFPELNIPEDAEHFVVDKAMFVELIPYLQQRHDRISDLEAQVERLEALPGTAAASQGNTTRPPPPPPAGDTTTPPASGAGTGTTSGTGTPPSGGGTTPPPTDGGTTTPPTDGGTATPPTDGGTTTPPPVDVDHRSPHNI